MDKKNLYERKNWIRWVAGKNYSYQLLVKAIENSPEPDLVLIECALVFLYAMENVPPKFGTLGINFLKRNKEEIKRIFSLLPEESELVLVNNWIFFGKLVKKMIKKGAIPKYTPKQLTKLIFLHCKTGYTKRTILNKLKDLLS